jgi:hypothetical protein
MNKAKPAAPSKFALTLSRKAIRVLTDATRPAPEGQRLSDPTVACSLDPDQC